MKNILQIMALGVLMAAGGGAAPVEPATMPRIGTVDPRFQSFNVEMVEVTGGRFWAPYKGEKKAEAAPTSKLATPGLDPSKFRMRPPIDLSNARLRKLAAALGPSYMRVSGTWANSTYFHDSDEPAPASPPAGFGGVLTRAEWRGVVDFAHAVDAKIVTSFAISDGVRDAKGLWTPVEARKVLAFTKSIGGSISAAELFNEPSFASMGGAPKGYDAAAYGRDFSIFRSFAKENAPEMIVLGPGSVGEGPALGAFSVIKTEDMFRATGGGVVDAFSYHFYGTVSQRCASLNDAGQRTPEGALSLEWLGRTEKEEAFYAGLRDRFEPGKPIWLTETGETACGGNPWAATFTDSFRYLNQLGTLAKKGVQVVAHNTLAASDYGLIDEATLTPRPNYWSALLWRRMMGTTVLDAGASPVPDVHLYAHCLAGKPGGVAMLVINADRTGSHELEIPKESERFVLTSRDMEGPSVQLNGKELALGANDDLPKLTGKRTKAGRVKFAPASITFVAIPGAGNSSCQ